MDTGLEAIKYINFSTLAYTQFEDNARDHDIGYTLKNKTIEYLVNNKLIKEDNLSNPELSTLQNSSNPLRSYK